MAQMKEKLTGEAERLKSELSRFAKPVDGEGEYETKYQDMGTDRDENASEVEEYVDNKALETTLEHELREVNDALARIEAGTYGVCESCGKEIDLDRLNAYPAARTHTTCVVGE